MQSEPLHQQTTEQLMRSVVDQVSGSGTYQDRLLAYMLVLTELIALSACGPMMLYINPKFTCQGIGQPVGEDVACPRLETCTLQDSYSVTHHAQLYCSRKDDRNAIQAVFGLGAIIGVLFVNLVATFYGRSIGFKIGLVFGCAHAYTLLAGAYLKNVPILVASQFLAGVTFESLYVISILLLQKHASSTLAPYVVPLCNLFNNSLGLAVFSMIFHHWQALAYLLVVGYSIMFVISFWVIKQDPLYLFNNSMWQYLRLQLTELAEINQAKASELNQALATVEEVENGNDQTTSQPFGGIWSQFSCKIIVNLVSISCVCLGLNTIALGASYQLKDFKIDPSVTTFCYGCAHLAGSLLMTPLAPKLYSKFGLNYVSMGNGLVLALVGSLFLTSLPGSSSTATAICIFVFHVFWMTAAVNYVGSYVSSFPRSIENICASVSSAVGGLGKVSGPLLIRLAQGLHLNAFIMWIAVALMLVSLPPLCLTSGR